MVKIQKILFVIILFISTNLSSLSEYYPTPVTLKYYILPYLSTQDIINLYNFHKVIDSSVDLEKWLEYFDKNFVFNYSDLFKKSKIFFRVPKNKKNTIAILYDLQTKEATLGEEIDNDIPHDCFCLHFENRVFPIQKITSEIGETFWKVENTILKKFCIFDDQYKSKISWGPIPLELGTEYEKYIFQARKLKGMKKLSLDIQYFLTKPYLYYLNFISPSVSRFIPEDDDRSIFFAFQLLRSAFLRVQLATMPFDIFTILLQFTFMDQIPFIIKLQPIFCFSDYIVHQTSNLLDWLWIYSLITFLFDFAYFSHCPPKFCEYFYNGKLYNLNSYQMKPKSEMRVVPLLIEKENRNLAFAEIKLINLFKMLLVVSLKALLRAFFPLT